MVNLLGIWYDYRVYRCFFSYNHMKNSCKEIYSQMMKLLTKNYFDSNTRHNKKYQKIVDQINKLEPVFEKLPDNELRAKAYEFQIALQKGKTVEDICVEAFAVVR